MQFAYSPSFSPRAFGDGSTTLSSGASAFGGMPSPLTPAFWFVMSMALLAGFVAAFPMNWWLVAKGLKHGMMTVRRPAAARSTHEPSDATHQTMRAVSDKEHAGHASVVRIEIIWVTILSVAVFALGIGAAELLSRLGGM